MTEPKKPKPRCKNCGDETTFPANCDWTRENRGWCVPCFNVWKQHDRYSKDRRVPRFQDD